MESESESIFEVGVGVGVGVTLKSIDSAALLSASGCTTALFRPHKNGTVRTVLPSSFVWHVPPRRACLDTSHIGKQRMESVPNAYVGQAKRHKPEWYDVEQNSTGCTIWKGERYEI